MSKALKKLRKSTEHIRKAIRRMNQELVDFAAAVDVSFGTMEDAITDIAADEQAQKEEIDRLHALGDQLPQEAKALLDRIKTRAAAMAARSKELSENIPNLPELPTGGTGGTTDQPPATPAPAEQL